VEHGSLLEAAGEAEVELLKRLSGGEARRPDPQLAAGGIARGDLARQKRLGEAFVAPFLGPGPLGELW
jgi:hypothetical protein